MGTNLSPSRDGETRARVGARLVGALRARYDRRGVLILFGLFAVAAISGVARWYASTGLDPFEDGYQHWWIASNLAETGEFWDRHSKMTEGNWLPLYDLSLIHI